MLIEDLWKAIETDVSGEHSSKGGWLLRLARSVPGYPMFVGLEVANRRRAVLLRLPANSLPARRLWPRTKGLEPLAVSIDGETYFGVGLKEARFADVFTALAEDLGRRVNASDDSATQANAFLGQLSRWQKFLSASSDGLSDEAQRGLWGELHFLYEKLLPAMGPVAVAGWKGAERAHQDFQFEQCAIEVKTTLAKLPQVVRITNERQLDATGWGSLFLHVTALDVRDGAGRTLPALVAELRTAMASDPSAAEQFEDELLAAGYFDVHAPRYSTRGYTVRFMNSFCVQPGFPCLVETSLPTGIGDVSYSLSIAACDSFKVDVSNIQTAAASVRGPTSRGMKRG